jgi:hypothetical protein
MALFLPLVWLVFLLWLFNVLALRASFVDLWYEHNHMRDLMDQGHKDVLSASGDSFGSIFEYMYIAQTEYLGALQNFVAIGIIPTMITWFGVGFLGVRNDMRDPNDGHRAGIQAGGSEECGVTGQRQVSGSPSSALRAPSPQGEKRGFRSRGSIDISLFSPWGEVPSKARR